MSSLELRNLMPGQMCFLLLKMYTFVKKYFGIIISSSGSSRITVLIVS